MADGSTSYPPLFSPAEKLAAAGAHYDRAVKRWATGAAAIIRTRERLRRMTAEQARRTAALDLADSVYLPMLTGEGS